MVKHGFGSRCGRRVVFAAGLCSLASVGCASDLQARFQANIDYLASDELEGRGVGSEGIQLAADYIAKQFRQIGLEPIGDDYFQSFPMTTRRELGADGRLAFTGGTDELVQTRDFVPFGFSSAQPFDGGVVFCGYGIVAEDHDHDDYAEVDVSGRVVLILRGEPERWIEEEGGNGRYASFRSKVYNAKDRGAVAVLIVNQEPAEGAEDRLVPFATRGANAFGIAAIHLTRDVADAVLARGGLDSLSVLEERLEAGSLVSADLEHISATGEVVFERHTTPTHNVVGILRGGGRGDEAHEEFVVIGAHYDHLGRTVESTRRFKGGKLVRGSRTPKIHNGADDNASGTSGLIEIARLIAAGPRPRRSMVFVAFTAEESGLHGSKHFVEHSPIPMDKVVAMLNMDMIGRLNAESQELTVFGTGTADGLSAVVERASAGTGLTLATSESAGGRSDHASFVRRQIPALHFYTGNNSDYHKPTDTAEKINAEGGARVTTLVADIARELADGTQRLAFREVKEPKKAEPTGDTPAYRVVMGLAPAYEEDGQPGMRVDGVTAEGPADMAGMKAGDRILSIGGKKVANIYDYMASTRNNRPGDAVEVVVLRDGREVALKVTLASGG